MKFTERLKLETQGITLSSTELSVYLEEEGVTDSEAEYSPFSNIDKRNIYSAALSVLNSIANNPSMMKSYKSDDITITDFADSIQNRIDQLERKIRMMVVTDDMNSNNSMFMLFNS
ncbi:hypothetical protein JNUCC31_04250 [Paenibacillus sp. JNUCC31]|uniref:hypothetical protein n=1 Tax=Paenibacillus sp. JNUCC-31 TaxID=2777983 RepID=UPI00177D23F8|nr:hypothetical protein [Paenibacillus sp. JNUCC-31]QOS80159.1 hypothetical protein JNUCC31_04250 [Paenibacillus sp. JNUCC-31]